MNDDHHESIIQAVISDLLFEHLSNSNIWLTSNQREIPISKLSLDHLSNIITNFYDPDEPQTPYMIYYHDKILSEYFSRLNKKQEGETTWKSLSKA